LFENIFNQTMWELHEIEKKITQNKCNAKRYNAMRSFKNVIQESRAIKYPLTNYDTA